MASDLPAGRASQRVRRQLRIIRHVALDMDGTIYTNKTLFKTTAPFLALLDRLGIGHAFLTNNPSRSTAEYLAHLRAMGIQANTEQLYSSTPTGLAWSNETRLGGREKSARGLAHSRTLARIMTIHCARSVMECGGPPPLWPNASQRTQPRIPGRPRPYDSYHRQRA